MAISYERFSGADEIFNREEVNCINSLFEYCKIEHSDKFFLMHQINRFCNDKADCEESLQIHKIDRNIGILLLTFFNIPLARKNIQMKYSYNTKERTIIYKLIKKKSVGRPAVLTPEEKRANMLASKKRYAKSLKPIKKIIKDIYDSDYEPDCGDCADRGYADGNCNLCGRSNPKRFYPYVKSLKPIITEIPVS